MTFKQAIQGLVLASGFTAMISFAQQITGAGSTFISPALSQWAQAYTKQNGIQINYQSIGSGGGLRQLDFHSLDFAASDIPMPLSQLNRKNLLQFPILVGGIVPVVNIAGIQNNQLTLNGKVLADIYMGKVTKWNDPEIAALNPGISLPHALIISVHRSDDSGTTYYFTRYLSLVSPDWKNKVGANTLVSWPGFGLGAKGNAGIVAQVQNIPNAIGYVEYAYAAQNHLTAVKMQNQAGQTVSASSESFNAAVKHANWEQSPGFGASLLNQPGAESWPIVAATFIVVPDHQSSYSNNSAAVLKFFDWSYKNGQNAAKQLDYIALPKSVYQTIEKQWDKQLPGWDK